MAAKSDQETEIKLVAPSAAAIRRKVLALGYRVSAPRVFEANVVLDDDGESLKSTRRLLRLRTAGRVHTLTFKGPPEAGKHRTRLELESVVPDAGVLARLFEGLGFTPKFRYEKFRTEFRKPRAKGTIMLDELPFGVFVELEGDPAWIDRTAKALGYGEADYITTSYVGLSPATGDIVFPRRQR